MYKLVYYGGCGLLLALGGPRLAAAQAPADSSALLPGLAAARQAYDRTVRPESVLFNGPEYVDYVKPGTIGHPFFLEDTPQAGTITYRQAAFQAVPLRYDLLLDQVVMTYPGQTATIALVPAYVARFTLGPHQFVRLQADSATRRLLPTGFYELLQAGPVSLLARHSKRLEQTYVQQNLRFAYRQTDQLFARAAGTVVEVAKLNDLLALLPTHKAEVQRYARQQKLRFGAAQREASAVAALRYYYTLPQ